MPGRLQRRYTPSRSRIGLKPSRSKKDLKGGKPSRSGRRQRFTSNSCSECASASHHRGAFSCFPRSRRSCPQTKLPASRLQRPRCAYRFDPGTSGRGKSPLHSLQNFPRLLPKPEGYSHPSRWSAHQEAASCHLPSA